MGRARGAPDGRAGRLIRCVRAPARANDGLIADTRPLPPLLAEALRPARQEVSRHAGPNGVGKSTVLRLLAGEEAPDAGRVGIDPPRATVAYLPQEPERRAGETLRGRLGRLTGVAAAERELEAAATALAREPENACVDSTQASVDRYDAALAQFLALGGGDLDARAAATCARLGLGVDLDRAFDGLSGGEAARASLAALLLAQADLLLLDEPTNDLDADGLAQLETFVDGFPGAIVVVSHDRAFLDRTVRHIAEIDPRSHAIVEWAGGWSDYARRRDEARRAAYTRFADASDRRRELTTLLSTRRTDARAQGAGLGERTGGADRPACRTRRRWARPPERRSRAAPGGQARRSGAWGGRGQATDGRPRGVGTRADRGPRPQALVFDDAGHAVDIAVPHLPEATEFASNAVTLVSGGTRQADALACNASWPRLLALLERVARRSG